LGKRSGTAAATGKAARLAKRPEGRNAALAGAKLLRFGTKVNALFTLVPRERYPFVMLIHATAAALAAWSPNATAAPAAASVTTQARVRIITGAVLRLGEGSRMGEGPRAQATRVRLEGALQPAKLIEFE